MAGPISRPTLNRPSLQKSKKTAVRLAESIVREIVDQGMQQGAMLPPERDMLEHYQVGRGTLREALRYLELQGVVTMKTGPGGGPMVTNPDSRHLASTLALLLELDATPFREIVEARLILEPQLAQHACRSITVEKLTEIQESVLLMGENLSNRELFLRENIRFHELIAWGSGNHVFGHMISSLWWITDGTALGIDYNEARRRTVLSAHTKILDALLRRADSDAETAMRHHLDQYSVYIAQHYPQVMDQPIFWEQYE